MRVIRITYDTVTPPDEDDGNCEHESGWEDEEGVDMEPDEYDVEEGVTAVDKAAKFLRDEGASETSGYPFQPGDWYSTEYCVNDYSTGEQSKRSFFLDGFTPEEEAAVFCGVFPERAVAEHATAERIAVMQRRRHRVAEAIESHGRCQRAGYCVEHDADRRVPPCAAGRRGRGRARKT